MRKFVEYLDEIPGYILVTGNLGIVLLLGLADLYTGLELSFSIFYLLPIAIVSWYSEKAAGIFLSVTSAIIWGAADLGAGHVYASGLIPLWNSLMRLVLFLTISQLLVSLRKNLNMIHDRELELQKELTIIKTMQKLTGIIAENITSQNSEILKWIESQKENNQTVPAEVERASKIIGSSLHVLTEVSFVSPFIGDSHLDVDGYAEHLSNKLSAVKDKFHTDAPREGFG